MEVHVNCHPATRVAARIHVHGCALHPLGSAGAESMSSCLWSEHDIAWRNANRATAAAGLGTAILAQSDPEMVGIAQWALDLVMGGG